MKYYSIFENKFQDCLIKSDVVVHKLLYKKHISRDDFNNYIKSVVDNVSKKKNSKEYVLNDYENAFKHSSEFITEMNTVSKDLEYHLNDYYKKIIDNL